jgi:hypothetical protein
MGYIIGINLLIVRENSSFAEVWQVLLFFFLTFLTRFATLLLLHPIMQFVGGYAFDGKKVALLTLNNFRSDALLIMCILFFFDAAVPQYLRYKALFWSTMIVVFFHSLTFFVVRPALLSLNLAPKTPAKDALFLSF